jgi:hypothetical protein
MIKAIGPSPVVAQPARTTVARVGTTLYIADPQFEREGARSWLDNAGMDRFIPSAHRNVAAMLTAPLYTDTSLREVKRPKDSVPLKEPIKMQVLGDIADTPCVSEMSDFEAVLARHPEIPAVGINRGNHSSASAFGVVNTLSRPYQWLKKIFLKEKEDTLEKQLCEKCGGPGTPLNPQKTFEAMHRILNRRRPHAPPVEAINVEVHEANYEGFRLKPEGKRIGFETDKRQRIFATFWRQAPGREPHWECLVNYQIANQPERDRKSKVSPFYIQASEEGRVQTADGREVPIFTISLDSQDLENPVAVLPGISELQVRLVEIFIDQMKAKHPDALFKLSAHFPVGQILGRREAWYDIRSWFNRTSRAARRAFKRLLSREEVILFASGHIHRRQVQDLTKTLGLKRKSPLREIVVPSVTDFSPVRKAGSDKLSDARAIGIETMTVEKGEDGKHLLKIDVDYKGLDPEDLKGKGLTPAVEEAVSRQTREHGYQKTLETMLQKFGKIRYLGFGGPFGRFLIWQFLKKRLWSLWGFVTRVALPLPFLWIPFLWKRFQNYLQKPSFLQDIFDALTVVSTEQMFNEAEHLLPFFESLTQFIAKETEPGDAASEALFAGVQKVYANLKMHYQARRPAFDDAVKKKADATELTQYKDLFERAGLGDLSAMLLNLKDDGEARAFAVMVGLESAQAEYEFHRWKPTEVPNDALTVTIPIG